MQKIKNRALTGLFLAGLGLGLVGFSGSSAKDAYYLPKGFRLTPFLSKAPVREFKEAKYVLKDNTNYQAVIETTKGRMVVDLFEDDTPTTVNNFVFLALNHFYDGILFHRVLKDFMAQTGDPKGDGTGGPGYSFGDEFRQKLKFVKRGQLAMANSGPNTNGSQFFITFKATDWLSGKHTIFGQLIEGDATLAKIKLIEPGQADADKMTRVYIIEKKQ